MSRRPQSPATQAVESHFRKMMQALTSSIENATASLKESLADVSQHLTKDLGDSEGLTEGQLQVRKCDGTTITHCGPKVIHESLCRYNLKNTPCPLSFTDKSTTSSTCQH